MKELGKKDMHLLKQVLVLFTSGSLTSVLVVSMHVKYKILTFRGDEWIHGAAGIFSVLMGT